MMPLVTEVGLGLGDIVLDGEPAPPKRGTHPNFEPMSIVAKRLYASGYHLVWLSLSDIVLDGYLAPLP